MKYKAVPPHTKDEAEVAFVQGTSAEITDALLGVTYYVEDWRWVQTACLALLDRSDTQVQWVAIQCLGHLATFHRTLDLAIVLPALQAHESNPKLMGVVSNILADLSDADLREADLSNAYLVGANLQGANLGCVAKNFRGTQEAGELRHTIEFRWRSQTVQQ